MDLQKELRDLALAIQKDFGVGSLTLLGDDSSLMEIQASRMPSGLHTFDNASNGGLVKGGMSEFYGTEAGGKTTLALTIAGEAQKRGEQVYFIDAEHKLNLEYAQRLGVDTDKLLFTQPRYGEQALDIMQSVAQSGLVDLMIVDSIASLVPKADIDGDFTDANMGAHARMMSKMCRVMAPILQQNGIHLLLINQIRHKIGVFFGSPETTPGGNAVKFYAGMRIRVSASQVKVGGTVSEEQRDVNLSFVKMQWGTPYKKVTLRLILGEGFDRALDIIEYGIEKGVLKMASSSVQYKGKSLGNGKSNAGKALLENPALMKEILKEITNESKPKKA